MKNKKSIKRNIEESISYPQLIRTPLLLGDFFKILRIQCTSNTLKVRWQEFSPPYVKGRNQIDKCFEFKFRINIPLYWHINQFL